MQKNFYPLLLRLEAGPGVATQKIEANYSQVHKYLPSLQSIVGNKAEFLCGYEAGCLDYTLYHQLTKFNIKCVILVPSTMMATAKKELKQIKTENQKVKI